MNFKKFFIYIIAFLSGAIVLVLEISGTRILAPFYGVTIYVWAAMITITLFSLSMGYFAGGKVADKFSEKNLLSFILFLSAFFIFIIPYISNYVLFITSQTGHKAGAFLSSFLILAIPLFFLGSITPYCLKLSAGDIKKIGITAGKLYGISTLGSLSGALITVFLLIPYLSIKFIIFLLSLILFLSALFWVLIEKQIKKILLFIIYALILYIIIYFIPELKIARKTIIKYNKNTVYSNIKVIEQKNFRSLLLDGALQGDYDLFSNRFIGDYLKLMAKGVRYVKNSENALILGLGCGALKSELERENINSVFVEIDPEIKKVAENYFGFKGDVIIDDARHFIKNSKKSFDLIFVDVYNGFNFCWYLFSKEATEEMKKILNQGGLIIINTIGNVIKDKNTAISSDKHIILINETIKSVFENVKLKATNENMANIVFYAGDFDFNLDDEYIDVDIVKKGKVLTDDYNPLEFFSKEIAWKWWTDQLKMLGKDAFL